MEAKDTIEVFEHLHLNRFLDEDGYFVHSCIGKVYLQAGRYSTPCRIYGIYAEIYINGNTRIVYAENGLPYRADLKVGTLDEKGYFHFDPAK